MESTFAGIEIGKRGVMTHSKALSTVGHNMSNASVEGYSRQRVIMSPFPPLYVPGLNRAETAGQLGQGVISERVERVRDGLLEARIVSQANGQGYWEARDKYLLMTEQVYNEPTDYSVRSLMDSYWDAWQELSLNPSQMAGRKAVLQRGEALVDAIHSRYYDLKSIRDMLNDDVKVSVKEINSILKEIAALNEEILKSKAMGDNPNDLLDRRDLLTEKLSGYVDITIDTRDEDEYLIHSGGLHLVQGKVYNPLKAEADPENEGYARVAWEKNNETAAFRGGKLAALVEMRDKDVRAQIQQLDLMTINFTDRVNEIHRHGYGLNGKTGNDFFTEYPFVNNLTGNYDRNGDGAFDASYIFRVTGNNQLKPKEQIGLRGTMTLSGAQGEVAVDYFPTDTVEDVIKRINNSGAEITAELDRGGRLSFRAVPAENVANPDFVIRHLEDSNQFLAGYAGILVAPGPAGAYDWETADAVLSLRGGGVEYAVAPLAHPAGWIEVNPALKTDAAAIAAGFGANGKPAKPGDGSAARSIAALRNQDIMIGKIRGFDEYFATVVAEVGEKGRQAKDALETEKLRMKELLDMRESISGVNMDEELANMIKFQHGYAAAARFITEFNRMLDTIINRMGV